MSRVRSLFPFITFFVNSQILVADVHPYEVYVTNSSTFGSITALGISGLAGLGPSSSSVVFTDLGTKGDALLENIFQVRTRR